MQKQPRFLVIPAWKQVQKSYSRLNSPAVKQFFAKKEIKNALRVAAFFVASYILIVASAAIMLFQFGMTNSFTTFAEKIYAYPAAYVGNDSIKLREFRLEVDARKHYAGVKNIAYTDAEVEKFVMDQLITRKIYEGILRENKFVILDSDLDARMEEIISQAGGEDKLSLFLKNEYGEAITLDVFRKWMYAVAVETAIREKVIARATLKHILVAVPSGSSEDVVAKAREKAQEIRASITSAENFSEIAKQRSEDAASRDKGGEIGTTNRGDTTPVYSQEFENAAFQINVGDVSEPVLSSTGWHILTVTSRTGTKDLSLTALREQRKSSITIKKLLPDL